MRMWAITFLSLTMLVVFTPAVLAADIWYEDNNLGVSGGMPNDFFEQFQHPETFSQASQHIDVYMMRSSVLYKLDSHFLIDQFAPYLEKNEIKLAINTGGATYTQIKDRKKRIFEKDIRLLERLKLLGIEVDYISLQSVLSKSPKIDGKRIEYPLSKRMEDVVAYSTAVRDIYPRVEIGVIDALPSQGKDYKRPYRLLKDSLARQAIALSYIHLDIPFEIPRAQRRNVTWHSVREVERYVEDELHLKFGYFSTSKDGGKISSKAFHEQVMASLECYSDATGTPSAFIIASWFPHPQRTIPETATGDDYPAMRTVLEFGRRLEQIEKGGLSWPPRREPEWRAMCTA